MNFISRENEWLNEATVVYHCSNIVNQWRSGKQPTGTPKRARRSMYATSFKFTFGKMSQSEIRHNQQKKKDQTTILVFIFKDRRPQIHELRQRDTLLFTYLIQLMFY